MRLFTKRDWAGPGGWVLVTLLLAGCAQGAPTEAEPFAPGVLPDDLEHYRVTLTPSGDTAFFGAGEGFFPMTRQATIHQVVRVDGAWEEVTTAPFSGTWSDIDPFIDPAGRHLYFSSIREGSEAVDLWRVERTGNGWGTPERLELSTDDDELFPSVDASGRLFFARPLPSGDWGIWSAEVDGDRWLDPVPLGAEVNRPGTWNFNPTVTPEGDRLLFTRLAPDQAAATGFGQIHIAERSGEGWGEPRPLGPTVNTEQDEFHPSLSPDGRILFFVRRDPLADEPRGRLLMVPLHGALPN